MASDRWQNLVLNSAAPPSLPCSGSLNSPFVLCFVCSAPSKMVFVFTGLAIAGWRPLLGWPHNPTVHQRLLLLRLQEAVVCAIPRARECRFSASCHLYSTYSKVDTLFLCRLQKTVSRATTIQNKQIAVNVGVTKVSYLRQSLVTGCTRNSASIFGSSGSKLVGSSHVNRRKKRQR